MASTSNVYHPSTSTAVGTMLNNAGENGNGVVESAASLFQSDTLNQIMGSDSASLHIAQKQISTFQDSFPATGISGQTSLERGSGGSNIASKSTTSSTTSTSSTNTISSSNSSNNSNNNASASTSNLNAPQSLMQPQTPVRQTFSVLISNNANNLCSIAKFTVAHADGDRGWTGEPEYK